MFMRLLCSIWKETLTFCCPSKTSNESSETSEHKAEDSNGGPNESPKQESKKSRSKK